MRKARLITGVLLAACGLGIVGLVPYFYLRSNFISSSLLKRVNNELLKSPGDSPVSIPVSMQSNTLFGTLTIPSLKLEAPILQGVDDQQINVAVGHLPTSVLPGELGTSILAAHNATWFRHVDKLRPGNRITVRTTYGTYTFQVTGSKVVHTGDSVLNTTYPSVVLEACYPLNALYLTPYRYLVYGKMVSHSDSQAMTLTTTSVKYIAKIPPSIPPSETLLKSNSLPLGSLSYEGNPSMKFVQSNSPLFASDALVSLYLAWLHATADDKQSTIQQLGLNSNDNPLLGWPISDLSYESPLNLTLNVSGDRLISITADTIVRIHHSFLITLNASVNENNVKLQSVNVIEQ